MATYSSFGWGSLHWAERRFADRSTPNLHHGRFHGAPRRIPTPGLTRCSLDQTLTSFPSTPLAENHARDDEDTIEPLRFGAYDFRGHLGTLAQATPLSSEVEHSGHVGPEALITRSQDPPDNEYSDRDHGHCDDKRSTRESQGPPLSEGDPRRLNTRLHPRSCTRLRWITPGRSGVIAEHSYGVRPVNRAGVTGPAVCGVRFGGGSASAVVDVCVATHMRGLVPHDRVCEMRSGAVLSRRAWPVGALTVFSRVAPRVVAPVRSPRRAVDRGGYSIVASAQQCPASSRATATTTIVRGLPRASSACQRWCSRRALRSAWACTARGLPSRLRSSVTLLRDGGRWCQAASISSRRTWLLPALVIAPWRRRSPLEFSLGVRPRNGPSDSGTEPVPVAELDRQRERRQRRDATQTNEPADDIRVRRSRGELGDRLVERVPSALRVEHAAVALVEHDRERPALEALPAKPRVVCPRPRGRVVHEPMAEQQLREPVASPHQIAAGVFTGTNEVPRGFLFRRRDTYRRDLTKPKQPRQPLGITPVGLDPIGCSSDPRRRRDNAIDPRLGTRAREPVPGRPRLVHDPDRRRQRLQPRDRLVTPGGTRSDRTSPLP